MVIALYAIAFLMVLGGLGVLVRGAPFIGVDWGNTLILAGITAACSGALLAGLAAALGTLRGIAREFAEARERAPAADPSLLFGEAAGLRPTQLGPEPAHPDVGSGTPAGAADVQEFPPIRAAATAMASIPPDAALDEPVSAPVQLPGTQADPTPPAPPAFERSERPVPEFLTRPRAPAPVQDPYRAPEPSQVAQPAPTRTPADAEATAVRRPHMPTVEFRKDPVPSFDDEWPEALPPGAASSPHEGRHEPTPPHGSPAASEAAPVEHVAAADSAVPVADEPAQDAEASPAHEIGRYSSGGNSYVMFADGSIEAETPNGKFRFGSLDELKQFIASGGERPASAAG